jgi:hypothetical protein
VVVALIYRSIEREWIFVARATCSSFLKKIENSILKFQKILKKNPDVDNDMI